jgi:glycerophosphoryl diester phosphodiesterase
MKTALSLLVSGLVSAMAGVGDRPAIDDIRDRVPLDEFVIQAHRGGGRDLPENTIESVEAAWRWGVVPEADIRTSKDSVLCAFHDEQFGRLVKNASPELKKKGVADLPWQEIERLDVGSYAGQQYAGQRVPRLEDIFRRMAGHPRRCLYLDVKKASLEKMAQLVREYGIEKQVIFTSTNHDPIKKWKRIVPESRSLLWMGGSQDDLARRLVELEEDHFEGITSLQIHVFLQDPGSPEPFRPSPDFLRRVGRTLRARGIAYQALPWRTTDPKVYRALMDMGVESFASDHPRVTLQAVKDYYAGKTRH